MLNITNNIYQDIGEKKEQQDIIKIYKDILINNKSYNIYMILDSHKSIDAANYFIDNFINLLQNDTELNIKISIKNVINQLDDYIVQNEIDGGFSFGCIFISESLSCYIIVGDIEILIKNNNDISTTPKHNFYNKEELLRFTDGLTDNRYYGLNMSRCIGDYNIKNKNKNSPLISTPLIKLLKDFDIIYIYSDGLDKEILKDNDYDVDINNIKNIIKNYKYYDNISIIKISK